ncbi:MAG: hypothetical protein JJ863_18685 [Deltaproteobacteria bacterium]|nr:hypothetical protein [Deltaproteobacteria bacterium]
MEAKPQKRIAVAILLGTLMSTAFFLAQGTTGLLGAAFLKTGEGEFVAATNPAATARPTRERADDTDILTRNIFDSEQGSILTEEVEAVVEDDTGETVLEDVDPNNLPACTGSVRLVASVLNTRLPEWSFAAIVGAAGKAMLYRAGQSIDGDMLVAIRSESVVLEQNSRACRLGMFGVEEMNPTPRPVVAQAETPEPPERPGRDEGNISAADMESGITKISDTNFRVTRGLVNQVLENQAELMRTARVIPHEENGRVVGVKLYGIRRNSLLGRLGVQNGDMLRTINGYDMSSPDSALEAYARLREADNLTLSVVRRGQPMTIDYGITN